MDVTFGSPCSKWIEMLKLSLLCQFAISLSGPHCILRISRRAHAIGIQIRYGLLCLAALLPRLDVCGCWRRVLALSEQQDDKRHDTRVCGHQLATPLCSTDSDPQAVVRSVRLPLPAPLSPHRTVSALESVCRIYEEVGIYDQMIPLTLSLSPLLFRRASARVSE